MNHRLAAHARAPAPETLRLTPDLATVRPGKAHRADRLAGRAAARSRDAGDRQRDAGAALLQRAARHLACRRFTDRAVAQQRFLRHAERLALGCIGVSDVAALEPLRRSRDRGDRLRHPAAGAGLGRDQRAMRRPEFFSDLPRDLSDQKKSLLQSANTRSVYPAARMSSNITPKPPLKRISSCRIGGGFTTSKARNRKKAAACHQGSSARSPAPAGKRPLRPSTSRRDPRRQDSCR